MSLAALDIPGLLRLADQLRKDAALTPQASRTWNRFIEHLTENLLFIHRNFQYGRQPEIPTGSAGLASGPLALPARHVGSMQHRSDHLGVPAERCTVNEPPRQPRRIRCGFPVDVRLEWLIGAVDIESERDSSKKHSALVFLNRTQGAGQIKGGRLIDFTVKFPRTDAARGHLQIMCDQFDTNGLNPTADTPVANSRMTFTSVLPVLATDQWVADYDTRSGGSGIRFHVSLDLWGY